MVIQMANQIQEEVIEDIKKANDIVDVVGEYVQLKKQGRNYFGLCPFHGEKTPSFSVTQEKQIFHCFGCGKGGNVITFMMEIESLSFIEAVQFLAKRAGIFLPEWEEPRSSVSKENDTALSAFEWLTKYYHHMLKHSKQGKEGYRYLLHRGISDLTIEEFQLGFAPNDTDFTIEFLLKKGFHEAMLVKEGILSLQTNSKQVTDRFRGRVIFPIRNHFGKTVAFGGRIISEGEPKYLNSPESSLFHKGKLLFNFDLARKHIRKENEAILFEGYVDVIAAYQAGIKHAVATLGTSLTDYQAKLLRRYVDTCIICYDGDQAGIEAAYKAAKLLRQTGCNVKIANLPDGTDPDSYIRTLGGDAFRNDIIKKSEPYNSFYLRFLRRNFDFSQESERIRYVEAAIKHLALIKSSVEREYYLKELSNEFDFSLEVLREEIHKEQRKQQPKDKHSTNRIANKSFFIKNQRLLPAYHNAERKLLYWMLQDEQIADKVKEEIGAGFNIDSHKIIATHLFAFYEEGHHPDISLFLERIHDPEIKQLVTELAMSVDDTDISEPELMDYIDLIRKQGHDIKSIHSLKEQQRIAEQQRDPIRAAQIAKEIIEIQKQLKNR